MIRVIASLMVVVLILCTGCESGAGLEGSVTTVIEDMGLAADGLGPNKCDYLVTDEAVYLIVLSPDCEMSGFDGAPAISDALQADGSVYSFAGTVESTERTFDGREVEELVVSRLTLLEKGTGAPEWLIGL